MCQECFERNAHEKMEELRRYRISQLRGADRLRHYLDTLQKDAAWKKQDDQFFMRAYLQSRESTSIEKGARVFFAFLSVAVPVAARNLWRGIVMVALGSFELANDTSAFVRRLALGHKTRRLVNAPPGHRLLRLAEILFSPKTVALTFKPLIADWQFEYFEAIAKKFPPWRLRLISIRYYWYYAKACGLSKVGSLFRAIARS